MANSSLQINQGTNSAINFDLVGGTNTQVVALGYGTISTIGTIPDIPGGTITNLTSGTINLATVTGNVGVSSGTINVSTISSLPNTPGGTLGLITRVSTIGTLELGTVTLTNPTGTTVQFNNGTVDLLKAGTITRLEGGTVNLVTRVGNVGTIEVGTITTLPNIPGGTIGVVSNLTNGSVRMTVGTINEGTIRNLISGTINSATAVLNSGTINVGTFVMPSGTITVLPNLPQGSINVTAGTIGGKATSGAVASGNPVFVGGTDSGGTIYGLLTDINGVLQVNGTVTTGGAGTQAVRLIDGTLTTLSSGSIVVTNGTIGAIVPGVGATNLGKAEDAAHASGDTGVAMWGVRNDAGTAFGADGDYVPFSIDSGGNARVNVIAMPNINQATGTLNVGTVNTGTINTGTINAGTINAGTFRGDARTTQNILTYGTQVAGTAAIAATIIGSAAVGAGTSLWLQDVSVTNNNANVLCVLGFGTAQQGTNVLLRHNLGTSGAVGIEKPLAKAVNAGMTNQDLVFSLGAAGTVDLTFSYFISA